MDPFLSYTYDQNLFRKSEELRLGRADNMADTMENFNSRFIFVTQNQPELFKKLSEDESFEVGFKDKHTAVFRLKTKQ
jgi:hypothetical protein